MPKFILHEPLAVDLFNESHNTAQGTLQPWAKYLTNNTELLALMLERMESDLHCPQSQNEEALWRKGSWKLDIVI